MGYSDQYIDKIEKEKRYILLWVAIFDRQLTANDEFGHESSGCIAPSIIRDGRSGLELV